MARHSSTFTLDLFVSEEYYNLIHITEGDARKLWKDWQRKATLKNRKGGFSRKTKRN
jgi:DNA mismatch repair ATPase MutS